MDLLGFIVTVILLTASGALAPGPLFFQTISQGSKTGARSGLIFSLAHSLVEFSLVMLLAFGLLAVRNEVFIRTGIGVLGGVVLILFGLYQIMGSLKKKERDQEPQVSSHRLFFIGILFTALNPYFIVWWLTVGSNLILLALELAAFAGVIFMFLCHVWMDYVWLIAVSYFSKKGVNALGSTWYRVLIGLFGVILIYFGAVFLRDAL
ncbi:MAG: LysE family transporter, partial [Candidatus Thermoplasmatota archaeon]|nr:LysE family transporter [Candidatus Thermoplasmatota archaeon]